MVLFSSTDFLFLPLAGMRLPRKIYDHCGHIRQLLEFDVTPTNRPQRCAWCGCRNGSEQEDLFFGSKRKIRLECHRCFPGPRFVMDGYVTVCDRCLPYTIQDHKSKSEWPGVWIEEPLRRDPIGVFQYGYANDQRVANALEQVWKKVPYRNRRQMREYLQDDDRSREDGENTVAWRRLRIETLPRWPNWGQGVIGLNMARGHVIRLSATAVKRMSQRSLAALVAHELAHTFQRARGSARTGESREAEAQEIAGRWGFPDKDIFSG
jgi:hypothetical protein